MCITCFLFLQQSGESEVVKVIGEMLLEAKEKAGIPPDSPLEAVVGTCICNKQTT